MSTNDGTRTEVITSGTNDGKSFPGKGRKLVPDSGKDNRKEPSMVNDTNRINGDNNMDNIQGNNNRNININFNENNDNKDNSTEEAKGSKSVNVDCNCGGIRVGNYGDNGNTIQGSNNRNNIQGSNNGNINCNNNNADSYGKKNAN